MKIIMPNGNGFLVIKPRHMHMHTRTPKHQLSYCSALLPNFGASTCCHAISLFQYVLAGLEEASSALLPECYCGARQN